MDNKITGVQAARLLALKTGKPQNLCEALVKSLFARVGEGLRRDGIVKVRDFGTFKLTEVSARKSVDVNTGASNEIPSHMKVSFVPSKELAAAVNAPFEMFSTLELTEDVLEEQLMQEESESLAAGLDTTDIVAEEIREQEVTEMRKAQDEQREVEKKAAEDLAPVLAQETSDDAPESEGSDEVREMDGTDDGRGYEEPDEAEEAAEDEGDEADEPDEADESDESVEAGADAEISKRVPEPEISVSKDAVAVRKRSGFGRGFAWGISVGLLLLLVAVGVIWWIGMPKHSASDGGNAVAVVRIADSTAGESDLTAMTGEADEMAGEETGADIASVDAVAPTQPSDNRPVYDTISHTRYLTTMARDHYGNYHLWPYIYEENKSILGHPDRIRPGTRVVIPDLSKYGVDPKNPDDIAAAKKKGASIYARYK